MRTMIFGAGSDLGVHIDGTSLGPTQLMNDLNAFYKGESMMLDADKSIIKSRNLSDRRKNEYEIDKYNSQLYKNIVEKTKEEFFPIVVGGDNSVCIPSALACTKVNTDVGIIWIDAHANYNTFESTLTGNIDGLSLAAITGYKCNELRYYHDGKVIQPSRTVLIGGRGVSDKEKDNVRYSGITVFSQDDIKEKGIEAILDEAFKIAGYKTKGVHVCFDIDIIDPEFAPGVSTPEFDGITEEDAMKISEYLAKNIKEVLSFDIVQFNPLRDINRKTEQIALNILTQVVKAAEKKEKFEKKIY